MDQPFKYLGRRHRVLFHDVPTSIAIAKDSYPDDPRAVLSSYYHILYDEICSKNPRYKKHLENLVTLSRKKRKLGRKKTPQPIQELSVLIKDLKKATEAKRLARATSSAPGRRLSIPYSVLLLPKSMENWGPVKELRCLQKFSIRTRRKRLPKSLEGQS
jgi:hypothetical protein